MRSFLVLAVISAIVVGCSKEDSKTKSAAPPPVDLLTTTQWCSKYQMGKTTIFTRYNFKNEPSKKLTQDRIVDRGYGGEVYKGESLTTWELQKPGSIEPYVYDGYAIEIVSDDNRVGEMLKNEGLKPLGEQKIKSAIKLYGYFASIFLDSKSTLLAFPCDQLIDVSGKEPRAMAEFQVLFGQDIRNHMSLSSDSPEFWRAISMQAPIAEIALSPEEVSSRAWCSWWTSRERENGYSLMVTVRVFHPNGQTSTKRYSDSFKWLDEAFTTKLYSEYAASASKAKWTVGEKGSRIKYDTNIMGFNIPSAAKIVRDRYGRMALFGINTESSDYPLSVSPYDLYYDCSDKIPFQFQNGWDKWLPKITELQTKALE